MPGVKKPLLKHLNKLFSLLPFRLTLSTLAEIQDLTPGVFVGLNVLERNVVNAADHSRSNLLVRKILANAIHLSLNFGKLSVSQYKKPLGESGFDWPHRIEYPEIRRLGAPRAQPSS